MHLYCCCLTQQNNLLTDSVRPTLHYSLWPWKGRCQIKKNKKNWPNWKWGGDGRPGRCGSVALAISNITTPTELLTNREWLPGELLSGSELRRPSWVLDMKYQTCFFYAHGLNISAVPEEVALKLLTSSVSESFHNSFLQLVMTTVKSPLALHTFHRLC